MAVGKRTSYFILFLLFLFLFVYAVFSYSLTDPNLVLSQWEPYWDFQTYMWRTFFDNPPFLGQVYTWLILGLFGVYGAWLWVSKRWSVAQLPVEGSRVWKVICAWLLIIVPLLFSYNALSHDVFNYIFNARMVVEYQADPHVRVALDFASFDDWTRFMHNTHTSAPYWYGWTAISVPMYWIGKIVGAGRFVPVWLMFRVASLLSAGLLFVSLQSLARQLIKRSLTIAELSLLFLNPLFMLEVISNNHNDLWMMAPAVASFAVLLAHKGNSSLETFGWRVLSLGLLLISASTKLATLALLPLWIFVAQGQMVIEHFSNKIKDKLAVVGRFGRPVLNSLFRRGMRLVPLVASFFMFLPLFTTRSQQFLPWYLLWPMVWLPLISQKRWRSIVLIFSFSSMLRYVPRLMAGGFADPVPSQQRFMTWAVAGGLIVLWWLFVNRKEKGVWNA